MLILMKGGGLCNIVSVRLMKGFVCQNRTVLNVDKSVSLSGNGHVRHTDPVGHITQESSSAKVLLPSG